MGAAGGPVLLVIADSQRGESLRYALSRIGIPVVMAASPEDAVHRLADDAPQVVVVDAAYPGMDAELVVHRARRCPQTARSPVLVLVPPGTVEAPLLATGFAAVLDRSAAAQVLAQQVVSRLEA